MAKQLHNFDGNEVIATELPQYLNQNFTAIPSNMGVWEKNEAVEVGDIRLLSGRENTGYMLECVASGTTGSTQPVIVEEDSTIIANYADAGVVGRMRVIFNSAEKDVDEVYATGVEYSRSSYPELWEYVQQRAGLLIDEADWQAKLVVSNGKFVPYYSRGNGSSTFRTPMLGGYLKGAEASGDVGEFVDAGLPALPDMSHTHTRGTMDITGSIQTYSNYNKGNADSVGLYTGAFYWTTDLENTSASYGTSTNVTDGDKDAIRKVPFQASRSWTGNTSKFTPPTFNSIYGNSSTVTPETMTGVWVIKAVGIIIDQGSTNIQEILNGVNETQDRLTTVENDYLKRSGGTMSGTIINTNGYPLQRSNDTGAIIIRGGTDNSSSSLQLYGKGHSSSPGIFALKTGDVDNEYYLIGKPNGQLTWMGYEIRFVRTTYKSGTTWYRIWSDGWVEQGGAVKPSGSSATTSTVTLSKAFSDTDYFVIANYGASSTNQYGQCYNKTTTGFTTKSYGGNFNTWYACGY